MISPKFVFIAREVLKFIRNGGKLNYRHLYKDGYCCPLGAVCINAGYENDNSTKSDVIWQNKWYDFAYEKTKLTGSFWCGFDDNYFDGDFTDVELQSRTEDFVIGYKLAQFCKKRNWL